MTFLRCVLAAGLLLSFAASTADATPAAATTPTEPVAADAGQEAFNLWLVAHNANDRALFEAFNKKYQYPADPQIDIDFRESVGRLEFIEFRRSSATGVEALVISEWGNALLARIGLAADDPLQMESMEFENVPTPAEHRPAPMPLDALEAEAKRRLDALAAQDKVSGSVLLARDGQPVFEWHGGMADREAAVPVTAATQFRMASLGKMFTAVAILQLAEAGKLSLDDRLSKHLPDYPNKTVADAVTLRQLLTHTAGTGNIFDDEFPKISDTLRTHRDYWGAFAAAPLDFEAGSQEQYSNYGYLLLGSVIEAVSGQSYYDYVDGHIHRPAGMTATGSEPESVSVPRRAHAYTRTEGEWTRETRTLPWRGMAAGGSYTTAGDLMRFATALQDGTLLSAESLQAATRPQNLKGWYGYGFMVSGDGDRRQFGHEGGAPGSNAILNVRPATGYTVVGLGNFDPSTLANIVNFVTHRLP